MLYEQISKNVVEEAIEEAARIADKAPEKYQQATFRTVFEMLLKKSEIIDVQATVSKPTPQKPSVKASKENPDAPNILELRYEWSSTKIPSLKGVAQYLAVIEIALNEFKIDGLTAKNVQEILFEKFRISKTPNTVSMTLMEAVGKYVDRVSVGNQYYYRITKNGIDFLRQEEAKTGSAQ